MLNDLKGPYYFGKLSKKVSKEYEKDGKKGINYNLVFDFMGGRHSIGSNESINNLLDEGKFYALPLGFYTNEKLDFTSLFIKTKDNDSIYEIIEGELILVN